MNTKQRNQIIKTLRIITALFALAAVGAVLFIVGVLAFEYVQNPDMFMRHMLGNDGEALVFEILPLFVGLPGLLAGSFYWTATFVANGEGD